MIARIKGFMKIQLKAHKEVKHVNMDGKSTLAGRKMVKLLNKQSWFRNPRQTEDTNSNMGVRK